MPNCNPITISNCPPVNDCDACKEIVNAKCVKYTGNNLTCIDVTKNENLEQILIDINSAICELTGGGGSACNVPQASIKLHRTGTVLGYPAYSFFSSSAPVYAGCVKSYKIFDTDDTELFSGTLAGATGYALTSLDTNSPYYIVEYIDCGDCGSTESENLCFKITLTELTRIIQRSCDCCPN